MAKNKGRPTYNPKLHRVTARIDEECKKILELYKIHEGVNQMQAIRIGIRKLASDLK